MAMLLHVKHGSRAIVSKNNCNFIFVPDYKYNVAREGRVERQ